jgi:GNAT superfamily N-acetyltransferase
MSGPVRVWTLDAASMDEVRPRLCEILVDCVDHGASIGFLAPLEEADVDTYWRRVRRAVAEGRCLLLAASLDEGAVAGTVQLDVDTLPNQPHRATVSKLLVHTTARRRGVGEALMAGVERVALEHGRWLLTLDTDAERLYGRLGWTLAGVIPCYALNPDSTLTHTSYYWKQLRPAPGFEPGPRDPTAIAPQARKRA